MMLVDTPSKKRHVRVWADTPISLGPGKRMRTYEHLAGVGPFAISGQLMTAWEAGALAQLVRRNKKRWEPVGTDGILAHYSPGDNLGSWRFTVESPAVAQQLWHRLPAQDVSPGHPTDTDGSTWRPVGVSPRLRFIVYRPGGVLVPHYDAPFVVGPDERTLRSVVVSLQAARRGGATRFVVDPQRQVPVEERDLSDLPLGANLDVLAAPTMGPGRCLVFDHRILHDGAPVEEGLKILMRTDLLYRRKP